jgi:hypothetical protein
MQESMKAGANAIVIPALGYDNKVSSIGGGIGIAYAEGSLTGTEKDRASSGSGGTGLAFSSVKNNSLPKALGIMILDENGMKIVELLMEKKVSYIQDLPVIFGEKAETKPAATKEIVSSLLPKSKGDEFRCIATGNYTPPASCK